MAYKGASYDTEQIYIKWIYIKVDVTNVYTVLGISALKLVHNS